MFILKGIKSSLKILFEELLNILYIKSCINCGCEIKSGSLCKSCLKTVNILPVFAHKVIDGVEIHSACCYEGAVKKLIHKIKFSNSPKCAKELAIILNTYFQDLSLKKNINLKNSVIIPVPASKYNIKKRGYDNLYEICKHFCDMNNIKLCGNFLCKIKHTEPMYKVGAKERKRNIKDSFALNLKSNPHNKFIIIVDDIVTTGATFGEIIKLVQNKGYKNIVCISVSKSSV